MQARPDHFVCQLGTGGGKEQRLRPGRQRACLRAEQDRPDRLAGARATRLACGLDGVALLGKRFCEAMDLRRLSASLGTLETDEEPASFPRGFHSR